MNLIIRYILFTKTRNKLKSLKDHLKMSPNEPIRKNTETYETFLQYLKIKQDRRLFLVALIHNLIRIFNLWVKLKFFGYFIVLIIRYKQINPIFDVFIGFISKWISIYKIGLSSPSLVTITRKNDKYFKRRDSNTKMRLIRSYSSIFDGGWNSDSDFSELIQKNSFSVNEKNVFKSSLDNL